MRTIRTLLGAAALLVVAMPTSARQVATEDELVRVYLDCQGCDSEYVRTEITFVDYVRDRTAADVHLLITFQSTGARGRSYVLNFIGRHRFEGVNDTLAFVSSGDATPDLIRQGLTRTIKLGLVRFVAGTKAADRLDVRYSDAPANAPAAQTGPARDPWNQWIFAIRTNSFLDGESTRNAISLGLSLSANRTTDLWKFGFEIDGNYREANIELDSITKIKDLNKSYSADISLVKSIGPKISAGMIANLSTTTFGNQELVARLAPAVEYNVFPYSESTRRQFTFTYSVGANSYDYREITIFGRTEETLGSHSLTASYSTRQPWGSTNISLNGSQFLNDMNKYRVVAGGSMSIRLFRGFSINGGGTYQRIRDQISLPAADATPEQILLRQRQLATNYRYFMNFGISYNFGSLFSAVVNPRMRSVIGGSEFFFF